jgi:DNA-binding CsgD family transcriptional regulator
MSTEASVGRARSLLAGGGTVLVVGPAGIGKTTLVRRIVDGTDHALGQALPAFAAVTYRPLGHALRRSVSGTPAEVATDMAASLRSTLLVVEDVHWADPATLDVLVQLAGRVPLLVTARPGPHVTPLASSAEVLQVEPLKRSAASALARRLHPALSAVERARLVAAAAGNPLLLHQLVMGTSSSPTLAAAIADRVRRLPIAVTDGLGRLALQGCPSRPALLGPGASAAEGLVVHDEEGNAWFSHEQIAVEVLALLDAPTRTRLLGELVEQVPERDRARHLRALGRDAEAAASAERAAGDAGPAERADLLALAVECLGDAAPASLRLSAAEALVGAHRAAGVRAVLGGIDGPAEVRAEVGLRHAQAAWLDGDAAAALQALDEALALLPGDPSPLRSALVIERAAILVRTRVGDPALPSIAAEARAAAAAAGVLVARAESVAGLACSHSGRPGWDAHFRAAAEQARAEGDLDEECAAMYWLVSACGFYGPLADALHIGATMLERARSLELHRWAHHFLGAHLVHRVAAGSWDDELLTAARELLVHEPRFRNRAQVELALVMAAVDREDIALATRVLDDAGAFARSAEDEAILRCAAIEAAAAAGELDRLCTLLHELSAAGVGFFGLNAGAESAALSACIAGARREDLPRFDSSLTPTLDVVAIERAGYDAWTRGVDGEAIDAFVRAAEMWDRRGFRRFGRRARFAAVDLALGSGERKQARALLDEIAALAPVSGTWVASGLARRQQHLDRATAGALLTAREVEILGLVAKGRSSAAIAEALGISVATVNTHVNAAVRKLGCRNRRQAAAMVGVA